MSDFYCRFCDYETNKPSDWLKHTSTEKHKRLGKKKTHTCEYQNCDYECKTAWNMKLHVLTQHLTKEDRAKQKYYCVDCDTVFVSQASKNTHTNGIKHKNYVEAIKELNRLNKIDNDE